MRISYSDLQLFKDCPFLFKYLRLERHSLPKSKEQIFGTLLHTSFKEILEKLPHLPLLEQVIKNFDERWHQSALESKMFDEHELKTYLNDAHRVIARLYQDETKDLPDVIALERGFELPLKDPKTGETHLITGRVDRIDRLAAGGFLVIDYKTGRSLPPEKSVQDNLQLAIYHLAIEQMWPNLIKRKKAPIKVALYYARHGEQISASLTKKALDLAKKTVLGIIREIRASDFSPKASPRCGAFPYNQACPYFKDQFRAEKPKINGEHEVAKIVSEYYELKRQEKEAKQKLAELNAMIQVYLNDQGLEAIYGAQGGIARQVTDAYEFDLKALKNILEPLGKWQEVLSVNTARLKEISAKLPDAVKDKIQDAKIPAGKRTALRLTKLA